MHLRPRAYESLALLSELSRRYAKSSKIDEATPDVLRYFQKQYRPRTFAAAAHLEGEYTLASKFARFRQSIKNIATPTGVYYTGRFGRGNCSLCYKLEVGDEDKNLTVWKSGEEIELKKDEVEFLLPVLSEFDRWQHYPRPHRIDGFGLASDEGSLVAACDILMYIILRRNIELTPVAVETLTHLGFELPELPAHSQPY